MDWSVTLQAFEDELEKISASLAGISTDTLLNYPKAQPMVTPAVDKALKVLDKVPELNKTSAAGPPDQLPQLGRFFNKRKKGSEPPPDKIDKLKSLGGHTLAGAGSGKFLADWVTKANASPKQRMIGMSVGGALGAAEFARKQVRKKRWQEGKKHGRV